MEENVYVLGLLLAMMILNIVQRDAQQPATYFFLPSWDEIRRWSFDKKLKKGDIITVLLISLGLIPITLGGVTTTYEFTIVGVWFIIPGLISYLLTHLKRTMTLVAVPHHETLKGRGETLRDLYLQIIKRWHPDHASDIKDFVRRNHITMLANRAMRANNLHRLRDLATLKRSENSC